MTEPMPSAKRSPSEPRPYGRRAFLGLLGAGLTSFWWAGPASRVLSPLSSQFSQLSADILPVGGWRIYTITGTMPDLDASSWTLEVGGLVKKPQTFSLADLRRLPQAKQVSTFHCVTGWTVKNVHWGGVRFHDILAAVEPLPDAHAIQFVSAEQPYTDSLTHRPGAAADDDARLRDGRLAALATARSPGPRGDPGDVRLQGREVAGAHGARREAARGLLGTARVRPERLGRPLEWLLARWPPPRWCRRTLGASHASRAPSARCTGRMRPHFWCCSAAASASICRAWPRRSAGGRS